MLKALGKAQPWAYQAMRIAAGFLFFCHGLQKFGLLGGRQVPLMSQVGLAGVIEVVGGALIAIGVAVSPVAFICSGEMAYAYFTSHMPRGGLPIQNGGELSVLYCFVFLYIAARGAGIWGVDKRTRV